MSIGGGARFRADGRTPGQLRPASVTLDVQKPNSPGGPWNALLSTTSTSFQAVPATGAAAVPTYSALVGPPGWFPVGPKSMFMENAAQALLVDAMAPPG